MKGFISAVAIVAASGGALVFVAIVAMSVAHPLAIGGAFAVIGAGLIGVVDLFTLHGGGWTRTAVVLAVGGACAFWIGASREEEYHLRSAEKWARKKRA